MNIHSIGLDVYRQWYQLTTGKCPPPLFADGSTDVPGLQSIAVDDEGQDPNSTEHAIEAETTTGTGAEGTPTAKTDTAYRGAGVRFVSESCTPFVLIIVRIVFSPMFRLIQKALALAGAAWEDTAAAKACLTGNNRDARLLVKARCELEQEATASLRDLFSDASTWDALPHAAMSVSLRSLAFKFASSVGSLVHELLIWPHRNYPFLTFTWTGHDDLVSCVSREKCHRRFDRWTASFVSFWSKQPGGLNSAGAKADLALTVQIGVDETVAIEAMHAAIRRELFSLNVQTKSCDFVDLSCRHVLRRLRQRILYARTLKPTIGAALWPSAEERALGATCNTCQPPSKKKRSPGGGAYRAFLHDVGHGLKNGCCTRGLAAQFRGLSQEQLSHYRELGQIGATVHKEGLPSFGVALGDGLAAQRKALKAAETHNLQINAQSQLASNAPVVLASQDVPDPGWDAQLKFVRKEISSGSASREFKQLAVRKTLANYVDQASATGGVVSNLPHGVQSLLKPECVPLPSVTGASLLFAKWAPANMCKNVAAAMQLKLCTKLGQRIHEALEQELECTHATVTHESVPKLGSVGGDRSTLCHAAGMCLCGEAGKAMIAMRRQFNQAIRQTLLRKASRKQLLQSCSVVLCLVGEAESEEGTFAEGCPDCLHLVWVHVGWQYLNPLRSTLHVFKGPAALEFISADRATWLAAAGQFATEWEVMSGLDPKLV